MGQDPESLNRPITSSRFVPSNIYEYTFEVKRGDKKPNRKYFNYANFNNIAWEVKIGLVYNVADSSLRTLSSTTFSLTHPDPTCSKRGSTLGFAHRQVTGNIFTVLPPGLERHQQFTYYGCTLSNIDYFTLQHRLLLSERECGKHSAVSLSEAQRHP